MIHFVLRKRNAIYLCCFFWILCDFKVGTIVDWVITFLDFEREFWILLAKESSADWLTSVWMPWRRNFDKFVPFIKGKKLLHGSLYTGLLNATLLNDFSNVSCRRASNSSLIEHTLLKAIFFQQMNNLSFDVFLSTRKSSTLPWMT